MTKNKWIAPAFGKYVSPDLVDDGLLDAEVVVLLEGNNLFGDKVYCYLQLTCANLKEIFRKIQASENFKPSEYGDVVASGRGEPPPEVKAAMHSEHEITDIPKPNPPFHINTTQPKFFDE